MEKVLVTGSSGFIGMHLCKNLLDDGYIVEGIDNMNDYYDLSLKEARLNLLSDYDNFNFNKIDISNLQDVEKVFPELVSTETGSDYKTVQYNGLIGVLVEAVKELTTKVEALEAA